MRIVVVSASNRQPRWVSDGFDEYARRLKGRATLELREIPLARRTPGVTTEQARAREGERMLAAVPRDARVVALDERGALWSTGELVERLRRWQELGSSLCLLIGGPDGLSPGCLERADEHWALSRLTLPHGLARIVVAESLYRARSVLEGHPYHRA